MSTIQEEKLLTTEQAAERLNLRPGLLREWKYLDEKTEHPEDRRGPRATKLGRAVRYKASELDRWVDEQNGGAS